MQWPGVVLCLHIFRSEPHIVGKRPAPKPNLKKLSEQTVSLRLQRYTFAKPTS